VPTDLDWIGFDGTGFGTIRIGPPEPRVVPAGLVPSIEERLAAIDARLRLEPDHRGLFAIAELERLLAPTRAASEGERAIAERARDGWEVSLDGRSLGLLPEYPDFSELLDLLEARVVVLQRYAGAPKLAPEAEERPALMTRLASFDDASIFEVLAVVDARWVAGEASVGDLRAAAHALARPALTVSDEFQLADGLYGRALATLAFARSYGENEVAHAECMLALALGYTTHAKQRAAVLAPDEPLVSFVRGDCEQLRLRAAPGGEPEAQFLYGLALARAGRSLEWAKWMGGSGRVRSRYRCCVRMRTSGISRTRVCCRTCWRCRYNGQ